MAASLCNSVDDSQVKLCYSSFWSYVLFYISLLTYLFGTYENRLIEATPMRTNKIMYVSMAEYLINTYLKMLHFWCCC